MPAPPLPTNIAGATTQQLATSGVPGATTQPLPAVIPQAQQSVVGAGPNFITSLTPTEKALFGSYLTHTVFPHVHGSKFPQGVPDLSIFEVFDQVELQWYYRYWKKQIASRM
jgi:hypothetical protein